jgi:type IV secretory pathway VirB6-like protein
MLYSQTYLYSVSESLPRISIESYVNIDSILTSSIFNSLRDMYRLDQLQIVALKSPERKRSARRTIDIRIECLPIDVSKCYMLMFRASNELSREILLLFFLHIISGKYCRAILAIGFMQNQLRHIR